MKSIPDASGFTLLEMLVVFGIVALVLSLSLPYIVASGESHKLTWEVNLIAVKLRETRLSALDFNMERELDFDMSRLTVTQRWSGKSILLSTGADMEIVTARDDVHANTGTIRFFPDGRSTGGTIKLSRGNFHQEISINWLTGAVMISR